jgi:hypothetical protein
MHTFCMLYPDFVQTNSLLCRPFAESVHTLSRAYVFHSIVAAQPAGARWPCHQGQKGRGGGATAAGAGDYFALGEAVEAAAAAGAALEGEAAAEPTDALGDVAAATTGAAAFQGEQAMAPGGGGGDMEAAFGDPFVPARSAALPSTPPPARTTPTSALRGPGGH